MIQFLFRLRGVVPRPLWWRIRAFYWRRFWSQEQRKQAVLLGAPAPDLAGSERACLVQQIVDLLPFKRVLEVGCAYGQNFHILAPLLPAVEFVGIDRDQNCVAEGAELFQREGITNVRLVHGDVGQLRDYGDRSFDVVYSSACFLYLAPQQAKQALIEMCRVGARAVLLLEQHRVGTADECEWRVTRAGDVGDYWIRDYQRALSDIVGAARVTISAVPAPLWSAEQWREYAHVIQVNLAG